jgi:hypothetical protein
MAGVGCRWRPVCCGLARRVVLCLICRREVSYLRVGLPTSLWVALGARQAALPRLLPRFVVADLGIGLPMSLWVALPGFSSPVVVDEGGRVQWKGNAGWRRSVEEGGGRWWMVSDMREEKGVKTNHDFRRGSFS